MLKVANSVINASRITGVLPVVNGGTGVTTSTGTGNTVLSAAPTLSGNVSLSTGNLIPGTAAKGINFTANTPAAGMTSQLLNWYEQGTWTPVLARSTGGDITAAYSTQTGLYTRIGNTVFISAIVHMTTISLQGTGNNYISGLPFNPSDNLVGSGSLGRNNAFTTDVVRSCGAWSDGKIYFYSNVNSQTETAVDWKAGYVTISLAYTI